MYFLLLTEQGSPCAVLLSRIRIYLLVVGLCIPGIQAAVQVFLHLVGAYLRGARQINYLYAFLIVADDEGVDVILVHVGALLFPVFLGDDMVHVAAGFDAIICYLYHRFYRLDDLLVL